MPGNNLLEAALEYAGLGYPVFPCVRATRSHLTEHGCQGCYDRRCDRSRVGGPEHPNANIGIRTTGLLVVDLDEGNTWLADEPDKLNELTVAPLSLTANGGRHFIFRQPAGRSWRNTAGRLAAHVDTRADGGYIVVPPSRPDRRQGLSMGRGTGARRAAGEPARATGVARRLSSTVSLQGTV